MTIPAPTPLTAVQAERIEALPLFYGADLNRMREVQAYRWGTIRAETDPRWLEMSHGSAHECREALFYSKPGFSGGLIEYPREEIRLVLDDGDSRRDEYWTGYDAKRDEINLSWGGPMLSVDRFLTWYDVRMK